MAHRSYRSIYLLNFDWLFFQVPVSSSGALDGSAMADVRQDGEVNIYSDLQCSHVARTTRWF
jgi:hypothetical protein